MDFNLRSLGDIVICLSQSLLGIYIVISISSLISINKYIGNLLAYIGSSSLFVLIFHLVVMAAVFKLIHLSENMYIMSLVAVLFGVIIPIVLLEITKRQLLLATVFLPAKRKVVSESN